MSGKSDTDEWQLKVEQKAEAPYSPFDRKMSTSCEKVEGNSQGVTLPVAPPRLEPKPARILRRR